MTPPRQFSKKMTALGLAFVLAATTATAVYAGNLGSRKVTLTDENPSATGVGYSFNFNPESTGSTIRRIEFKVSTTKGGSTVPTGMSTTSATLGAITGLTGTWTIDNTTQGTLKISNATGSAPTNPVTVPFAAITNSSLASSSTGYYFRISSYDAASGGTLIDEADVAFPITNSSFTASGSVSETISFSLSATSGSLGIFSSAATNTTSHTMSVSTNASSGYNISGQGNTLTSGTNTIPFVSDGAVTTGVAEYGLAFSGAAGHPAGDIGLASATSVASRSNPVSNDTTTATYKVSITDTTAAGNYSSTIKYVATATF